MTPVIFLTALSDDIYEEAALAGIRRTLYVNLVNSLVVQVQSSCLPLIDRNPQTFVDIYNAKAGDFVKATERVYRSAGAASCVKAGVRATR